MQSNSPKQERIIFLEFIYMHILYIEQHNLFLNIVKMWYKPMIYGPKPSGTSQTALIGRSLSVCSIYGWLKELINITRK